MVFDGVMLAAVAAELGQALAGAHVAGVYQPGRLDLVLDARGAGRNTSVFASAEAEAARVHATRVDRANPLAPPVFCMFLRKRLIGARISLVRQRGLDRILEIGFDGPYDDDPPRTLVVEVMGRHSNVILMDSRSGLVLECIKHVSEQMSRARPMRPGLHYVAPPSQGKLGLESASESDFEAALARCSREMVDLTCAQFLSRTFEGVGPDTAMVVVSRAGLGARRTCADVSSDERSALWRALAGCASRVRDRDFSFWAGEDPSTGAILWMSAIGPPGRGLDDASRGVPRRFETAAALLDHAYARQDRALSVASASADITRTVAAAIGRCRRKLEAQEREIAESEKAFGWRRAGELILANASNVPRGVARVRVVDYFDPALGVVEVELDPRLSPQENAQAYFARYSRAKRGLEAARAQAARTRAELDYLEQVAATIALAHDPSDLDEIRRELVDQGYLRAERPRGKPGRGAAAVSPEGLRARPRPRSRPRPLSFVVDGCEVLVGRNNSGNDALTMKIARPDDLWMHARGVPGAHVVVKVPPDGKISEMAVLRAAEIAAYYSRSREGSKVAVDYTARRNVRKPPGARPGMVLYSREKTLVVTPRPPRS